MREVGVVVDVSIVIPTINEESTIRECVNKAKKLFKEMRLEGEVIVADNSSDRTADIAKKHGAKVVTPNSLGYGNAYLAGFEAASGRYIAMADGDGTYDVFEMRKLLEPIIKKKADFVIGSRFKGEIKRGSMSFLHRRIGNPFFNWFLSRIYHIDISDSHCGMRAFTREAYKKMGLKTEGMEFASEMVIKAHNEGLRIEEVPINYYPRIGSKSKIKSFDDGWRHLRFITLSSPPSIFVYPGMLLMVVGLLLLLILMGGPSVLLGFPLYIHPMIFGSMFTVVGFQLYSLGLFSAVYRKKINADSKGESLLAANLRLETGLLVGMLALVAGLAIAGMIVYRWIASGFGPLGYEREAIVSSTLVALGVQVAFTSLFSSILSMD